MKRPGKCIGKKKFIYSHYAIETAKHQYIKYGRELGFYECPTCLDFHLTSKYCNLTHLHKKWKPTEAVTEVKTASKKTLKKRRQLQRKKERERLGIPPPPPLQKKQKPIVPKPGQVKKRLKYYWRRLLGVILSK